jgi:hypothetical protein
MRIYLLILITISLLFSCSTTKEITKGKKDFYYKFYNRDLPTFLIEADCNLNSNFGNFNFSYECLINHLNEIEINLYGPFGIFVGKLYADSNEFQFYNAFEDKFIIGKPTEENLLNISGVNISLQNLISILRNEILYSEEQFDEINSNNNLTIYRMISSKRFADFYSLNDQKLLQDYQRKDSLDNIVFKINYQYDNPYKYKDYVFANIINIYVAYNDIKLKYNIKNIDFETKKFPKKLNISNNSKILYLN